MAHSTLTSTAGALALCLTLYVAKLWISRTQSDIAKLPSPPDAATRLWGHERLVWEGTASEMWCKWVAQIGPLFRLKAALGHPDILIAADHAAVQHILQHTDLYVMAPAMRTPTANLIGEGVVWAIGDQHRRMRRVLASAFSPESIKRMSPDVIICAEELQSRLASDLPATGGVVNILPYITACTLDIIGRVAFGHDYHALSTSPTEDALQILDSWHDIVRNGTSEAMFIALPVIRMLPWLTDLPLPGLKAQGVTKRIVRKIAQDLIARARREGLETRKGDDILSMLLRGGDKAAERLTDHEIVENIVTFTMVGHDTTAGSLNFTLLLLARDQRVQDTLRAELLAHGPDLSPAALQRLDYLDAVVREGLRVQPASPMTERVAMADDVVPLSRPVAGLGALKLKAGQIIQIPFAALNTAAAVWGPDAADFNPDRWVRPGGVPAPAALPRGWSGLLTFSDGPRSCIGFRLAVLEFKVILATLVRTFKFEDTGRTVVPRIAPTLQPVVDGEPSMLPLRVSLVA